ncbi:MAG: MlaD family protein [Terriglobales bacterium]
MLRVAAIIVLGLAVIGLWVYPRACNRQITLKACFQDVRGLRRGALVRIAGVDVGRTSKVEAHPDRKDCLAEVEMSLSTPYELSVPSDAIARVENAGLLGEEFVAIDVRHASGSPSPDRSVLRTAPTIAPLDAVKAVVDAAADQTRDPKAKTSASGKAK